MRSNAQRGALATAVWLVAGASVGALATAAVVLGIRSLFDGDGSLEAMGPPRFVEETATAGLDHIYAGDSQFFFVGGGVAAFDCDGDRMADLFFAGGAAPAALYRNESRVGGELAFTRVSSPGTDLTGVTGAYPLDVDSDGTTDLALLRVGGNVMLRGMGDCEFEKANDVWGVGGGEQWTVAFSATWEADETLPTMVFGNYLAIEGGQRADGCADHFLFRPEAHGYDSPIRMTPGWCTLSMLFSDWSRTGRRDLRATNDRHYYRDGEEQLWRIEKGETPRPYTREDGWEEMRIWGMGIASQDVTGDGLPEVFLTSQGDNKLQSLSAASRPHYEDIALAQGATAHRPFAGDTDRPSTAWHPEFEDVNNDGFMDLFITKGNVDAMPEFAASDPNNLLIGRSDGTFAEGATEAGILDHSRSRGASVVDLNLDGLLDIVVVDRREPVKVWRNVGSGDRLQSEPMGSWLAIGLEQSGPNPDAIGAWVEVRTVDRSVSREITVGGGHAGDDLGWVHFGVGDASEAEIRVRWPDGEIGPWLSVGTDLFVIVERGATSPMDWDPVQD